MQRKLLVILYFFLCTTAFAQNETTEAEDLKKEIIDRCRADMGEYGAAMVKACVDQDIEALGKISDQIEAHQDIVARCMSSMREYGYSMVAACAEQDIDAESALKAY
jgi:hypothetical protein